jgi:hypothetical protein
MQCSCTDVNSPYKQKCWTNSGGLLGNSLLWGETFPRYLMGQVLSIMYECAVNTDSFSSYMASRMLFELADFFPTWPPADLGLHYFKWFPHPFKSKSKFWTSFSKKMWKNAIHFKFQLSNYLILASLKGSFLQLIFRIRIWIRIRPKVADPGP